MFRQGDGNERDSVNESEAGGSHLSIGDDVHRPDFAICDRCCVIDQRPFSSTCSTSEAVAAWIGRRAERAGPTPTPANGTDGDPDDEPAFTTRLEIVNGSRFSTLSVVLPSVRRAGLTVTKADATARSTTLLSVAPSSTEIEELSRNETLPSGSQASPAEHELTTIDAAGLAGLGVRQHDVQEERGALRRSEALRDSTT